ncbi:HET domain-containing protein, partial [Aspergillus ibericus CBS 121593]
MVVPSFTYSPLPQKSYTRMIRLLPDKDEDALIQCELFNYHLSQPGEVHLYEALSYVWGSSIRSRSIILDGYMLPVTESLHTALLHLRSKQLERILWIDAISINQDDDGEKSKQIPRMRMIYAQARRVVVWLGESQEYGDRALFQLGLLGRQKKISVRVGGKVREECEKLLQRDWFRRIWVLQEVGVAQSISIMCGTVQINGYNFCKGLDNLEPSSTLMARISPVSFLIRGASFRSYNDCHSTATLLIGELVSMYRSHKATKQHDKIYALLGLSSDSDSAALVPDYEIPWHEVFRRVTQHVFPKCFVEICYGQQTFKVAFNQTCQKLGYRDKWKAEWSLQASGELLQDGDIICLLEGLSQPSVLRLCADYYTVVTPVVRPKQQVQITEDDVTVRENCSAHGLCDIFMDWKVSEPEHETDGECLSKLTEITPKYSKEHCEAERRLNYTTTAMVDAAMQLLKLGETGKRALDNILFKGRIKGVDTNFLLSQSDGIVSGDLITAAEAVLWQKHESPYAWQKVLTVAARDPRPCGIIVTSILLQRLQDKLPVPEEVVKAAAAN